MASISACRPVQIFLVGARAIRSQIDMKLDYTGITREDFMAYFRDDEMLNKLTADDRVEIFSQVLTGSSDVTKVLLDQLPEDYGVGGLEVVEARNT